MGLNLAYDPPFPSDFLPALVLSLSDIMLFTVCGAVNLQMTEGDNLHQQQLSIL